MKKMLTIFLITLLIACSNTTTYSVLRKDPELKIMLVRDPKKRKEFNIKVTEAVYDKSKIGDIVKIKKSEILETYTNN